MRTISVVVPAYNSEQTLEACLLSLRRLDYPSYEVIVVDDASTDRTHAIAQRFASRCIRLTSNRGAAAARNEGARQARGEIIAFTDADCRVPPDWLTRIERTLGEGTAAVTGLYAAPQDDSILARFAGYDIRLRFWALKSRANVFGTYNGAVLQEAWKSVGGFDEGIPGASWEDVEFGLRLAESGFGLAIDNESEVVHRHPDRLWSYARKQAQKAYGQMQLRRSGWKSDYPDRKAALQLPLTILTLAAFSGLALTSRLSALALVFAAVGLCASNAGLLAAIRRREGLAEALLSLGYILLRNGSWLIGVLAAMRPKASPRRRPQADRNSLIRNQSADSTA